MHSRKIACHVYETKQQKKYDEHEHVKRERDESVR